MLGIATYTHSSCASHSPPPVVEDPEDADPRQHLNVVFISHVGTDSAILFNSFYLKFFKHDLFHLLLLKSTNMHRKQLVSTNTFF